MTCLYLNIKIGCESELLQLFCTVLQVDTLHPQEESLGYVGVQRSVFWVELSPWRYSGVINIGQCYAKIIFSLSVCEIAQEEWKCYYSISAWLKWHRQQENRCSAHKQMWSPAHLTMQTRLHFPENKTQKEVDCGPLTTGKQSKENWMGHFPWVVVSLRQEKLCGFMGYAQGLLLWWDVAVAD